jgi:hypothetical protein
MAITVPESSFPIMAVHERVMMMRVMVVMVVMESVLAHIAKDGIEKRERVSEDKVGVRMVVVAERSVLV